ncbi:Fic family protein [Herbiconiux sp. L3-i23]|uniref:Fic family protein n=1 Tax=Herbiconiux sp. L3-i23 TaxID=2905871 RepID=UPI002070DC45|nr:Fic family protein [Herbiconiux sp. L3-i23]BDI22462.1 Fic family protein [Herbiconiux sp. L3-i23]
MTSPSDEAWPAVAFEERTWDPATEVRDSFSPIRAESGPYRAIVPAAIAERPVRVDDAIAALAADATAELIRLDAEFGYRDEAVPPLLVRAESAASSSIERVSASALSVALAEFEESVDPAAGQLVSHSRAIELARARAASLDEDAIVSVQRTLMASSRPERRGRWRDQQVWIGGGARGPARAAFVPPHVSRLPAAMDDLIRFMRRPQLQPLVQIAVAHAQYETIHPFLEVNGRTGRSLVQAMLRRADVARTLVIPISAGLSEDTAGYFDALTRYRSGRLEPIVEIFATAAISAVESSRQMADDLVQVRSTWSQRCTARQGSGARRLLPLLETRPVLTSASAMEHLRVSAPNAQLAIDRLVADGILTQVGGARRNRVWAATGLLAVVDAFSERTRRQR